MCDRRACVPGVSSGIMLIHTDKAVALFSQRKYLATPYPLREGCADSVPQA